VNKTAILFTTQFWMEMRKGAPQLIQTLTLPRSLVYRRLPRATTRYDDTKSVQLPQCFHYGKGRPSVVTGTLYEAVVVCVYSCRDYLHISKGVSTLDHWIEFLYSLDYHKMCRIGTKHAYLLSYFTQICSLASSSILPGVLEVRGHVHI